MDDARVTPAAIVLAGGRSKRMGQDKASIPFCGRRMIDVVVDRVRALSDRVIVCARATADLHPVDAHIIEDERSFAGPLPALIAGLRAAGTKRSVVVACDMPFLSVPLLAAIADRLDEEHDAVVPITGDGPQPLHAAYGDCAIEPLLGALAAGERSLRGALDRLRVRWLEEDEWASIEPSGRSFLNVNTLAELEAAAALEA